jgi:hypothetical protein
LWSRRNGLPARHGRRGLDVVGVLGKVVGLASVLGILVLHVFQLLLVRINVQFGQLWIVGRRSVMLGWRNLRKSATKELPGD